MTEILLSDQIKLYVSQEGNPLSTPVVLLHGLGANADSWLLQVPVLVQAGYRTISPDFRGFGRSSPAPIPDLWDLTRDTVGVLNHLDIKSAHMIGISMGGTVAIRLALDYPDKVRKLVLINTFARLWPISPRTLVFFLYRLIVFRVFGLNAQARSVAKNMFPDPTQAVLRESLYAQIVQSNPQVYRHLMRELIRFDVHNRLNEIRQPTLVLTGAQDRTVSTVIQRYLADNIPGAIQKIIPGAGHGATGQMPELVNEALLDFLGRDATKTSP